MRIAVVVPFLDEEAHLGALLDSIAGQTRIPDRLLLVDDGSYDASVEIAEGFAGRHPYATVLRRPPRPPAADRLATASEYVAFNWGVERLDGDYDVVAKVDADLELTPQTIATLERALEADPSLGLVGAYLSVAGADGERVRERCPPYHVRGGTKFYRRACLDEIAPVPAILGWDTIDESVARMRGWRTASVEIPGGDPLHRRPTGSFDGSLRAFSRWGVCAYAAGFHPLWILLGTGARLKDRPQVLGAAAYAAGWAAAAGRRRPRVRREVREHVRREQLRRIRSRDFGSA